MPNQSLKSPEGKDLFLIANKTTTKSNNTEIKQIFVNRTEVEVIFGEYMGIPDIDSIFGHVAINVDGTVYSRAHGKYAKISKDKYMGGGELLPNGARSSGQIASRDSAGILLAVSIREKEIIKKELERRVAIDEDFKKKNPKESTYNLANNSCSSNVADVLELIGILAHDPRFAPTPTSPKEMFSILERSNRKLKTIKYDKK